ncbi:MAG: Fe-S protein assembly co-chaperone HscB [Reyranella sp.]|nr:Fe-S protein assembly co-chaperone HscB [Reyranella sp.]MDP3159271.1 Fe-S protein assembly co-chaperone HscB [Reyranella sp.]
MPAALDLEPATLDRVYFAAQRQWHPDRFVGRPPEERARASTEAAGLNDAYRILKDPLSRAFYLAELNGVELPGDGKTIDDPDLLMEAMEAREALHEAATPEAVDTLAVQARQDMQQALNGLGTLFLRHDNAAIRKALLRLRYLDKFAEEARARRTNLQRVKA